MHYVWICLGTFLIILPPVASAPTNLMAVQEGPTSIRVSWSPPTPLGDTTGYRIYYSGGSSGSVDVSDDNYLLTGLQNGESYTISIVAISQHLPSESLATDMEAMLGEDVHDLIIHEILRKKGKATQHNRKTKQDNTTCPRQLFFKEKTALGGIRTTLLPTELPKQLSWLGSNHIYNTKQPKHHKPDKQVNSNLV